MATYRPLKNPPISESVIDIRCRTDPKFDINRIAALRKDVGYAKSEEMKGASFMFRMGGSVPPEQAIDDLGIMGYRYISEDGKYIVQMRRDGLTFSRLPVYTNWETVFGEFSRLCHIYFAATQPMEVSRIAVRNINRCLFPLREFEANPGEFLSAPPIPPKNAPGIIGQWMTRFLVQDSSHQIHAIITQMNDAADAPAATYPLIMDFDVFSTYQLSPKIGDLLPRFQDLRTMKNLLFFSALTEKAAAFFE